jgi:hypothetical protein
VAKLRPNLSADVYWGRVFLRQIPLRVCFCLVELELPDLALRTVLPTLLLSLVELVLELELPLVAEQRAAPAAVALQVFFFLVFRLVNPDNH